ncbi:hypothetical protein ACIBCM_27785 [Streptomyces sp. NPDC051018]|uniref:hypothetical protein n=1 Tax=Streptomyces sp. NPDC051018 TaxID=3365639 RepID=UPI003790667C
MAEAVGWFHYERPATGKRVQPLKHWRVTTSYPHIARQVARRLGGALQTWQSPGPDRLEILTTTATVLIHVDDVTDRALTFRLPTTTPGTIPGPFLLCFPTWTLPEVMGNVTPPNDTEGNTVHELALTTAEFRTRNGMHLWYTRPLLTIPVP